MTHNPTPAPQATTSDTDTQCYRHTLHTLIDLGTSLATMVHDHAKAQVEAQTATPESLAAAAAALERATRIVRRTILLARSLDAPARSPARQTATARRQIIRAVQDAIQREPGKHPGRLEAEFRDRLDTPELAEALDDDIANRPIPDIIAEIVHDLGLGAIPGTTPFKRRTPPDLLHLVHQAARTTPPPRTPPLRRPATPHPA